MELSEKVKELVAVGASITANCQPCLQYHAEKALASGADSGEVKAAIEVGKQVRKGASAKMDASSPPSMKEAATGPGGREEVPPAAVDLRGARGRGSGTPLPPVFINYRNGGLS